MAQLLAEAAGRDPEGLFRRAGAEHCAATGTDAAGLAAALLATAVGPIPEDITATPLQQARGARSGDGKVGFADEPRRRASRSVAGTRYRVAVGHTHGARPEHIVGAITKEGGLRGADLGKIDIFASFSLIEIAGDISAESFRRIGGARVAGRPLRIALDKGPRNAGTDRGARKPPRH